MRRAKTWAATSAPPQPGRDLGGVSIASTLDTIPYDDKAPLPSHTTLNNTMVENTCCYSLALPAELRLHIYSYVALTVSLVESMSIYKGPVFSGKQVQAELEPITFKAVNLKLSGISRASLELWDDQVTFTMLRKLNKMDSLEVIMRPDWSAERASQLPKHPLNGLFDFHLQSLSIHIDCKQFLVSDWTCVSWLETLLCPVVAESARDMNIETVVADYSKSNDHFGGPPISTPFYRRSLSNKAWDVAAHRSVKGIQAVYFDRVIDIADHWPTISWVQVQ